MLGFGWLLTTLGVKCRWLLRAPWLSQELLSTFESEIGEVALVPGASGEFRVIASVWAKS